MTTIYNEKNWKRVPVDDLVNPKGGGPHMILREHWWCVDADNNVFFYKESSPQCNVNKSIVERLATHPDAVGVIHIPIAIYPFNISDYT